MIARHLVVSAVNFSEGGPLVILNDSLDAAAATLGAEWQITALVHDGKLVNCPRVKTIVYPNSKRSWFHRVAHEWFAFRRLSSQLKPDLWLSLHDMTPRVHARRQAVYCHNSSPFYRPRWFEARYDPRFFLFNKLYMQLYRAFIRRNYAVVVQSAWLRDAFRVATGHPNVVVAYPGTMADTPGPVPAAAPPPATVLRRPTPDRPLRLLYPALPRVFKNIELLCEAMRRLPAECDGLVEVRLTLDGTENPWARELVRRYNGTPGVRFIGRLDRAAMAGEYRVCDAVLFPSRLETWGLPITEAKAAAKPLLAADLPYAHETVGDYDRVTFLSPDDPATWATEFAAMTLPGWTPGAHRGVEPEPPFVRDWPSLWRYLTAGL